MHVPVHIKPSTSDPFLKDGADLGRISVSGAAIFIFIFFLNSPKLTDKYTQNCSF